MKKFLVAVALICLIASPALAVPSTAQFNALSDKVQVVEQNVQTVQSDLQTVQQNLDTATADLNSDIADQHNAYDYGLYLDLIALETPATEWGIKTTYTVEDSEVRNYVGGKIYLGRLFKK